MTQRPYPRARGQSLAEFAIVFPVMFLIVAAIIQFGLIFWAQNTLTQIARDTGRWAATQQDCNPASATPGVVAAANSLAGSSALFGYRPVPGWSSPTNVTVSWSGAPCPPNSNQQVAWVTIRLTHQVPIFFPFLPVSDTLSTEAEFRMEPISK